MYLKIKNYYLKIFMKIRVNEKVCENTKNGYLKTQTKYLLKLRYNIYVLFLKFLF